ncbi:hypothetical protein QR680_011051 [Steinernema hermaphroditum]|uniref:BHLH domain-containing protein n=1 Tax=Steinernema hermaphroditum TaxID=289476 RepID=A0AA39ISQ3_9BILA|nr:hypothetical protein QR680_011051 [Steinernema hermaphroditum]
MGKELARFQHQEIQLPKSRRQRSNINERKRNRDMNSAFDLLQSKMASRIYSLYLTLIHLFQSHIPMLPPPEKQRLSKIRTLRLAFQYIDFLKRILSDQNCETAPPRAIEDFANIVRSELTIRNSYSERAEQEQQLKPHPSSKSPQNNLSSPSSSHSSLDSYAYEQFYDLRHYGTGYSHHHHC